MIDADHLRHLADFLEADDWTGAIAFLNQEFKGYTVAEGIRRGVWNLITNSDLDESAKRQEYEQEGYLYLQAEVEAGVQAQSQELNVHPSEVDPELARPPGMPRGVLYTYVFRDTYEETPKHVTLAFLKAPIWDMWKNVSEEVAAHLEAEGYFDETLQLDADEVIAEQEAKERVGPQDVPDFAEPFGAGEVLEAEPEEDEPDLVANAERAATRTLMLSLLALPLGTPKPGTICAHCDDEIKGFGLSADDDWGTPDEKQTWWHKDCASEVLASLDEQEEGQGAEPQPESKALDPTLRDPAKVELARHADGKPYTARSGSAACELCLGQIAKGDRAIKCAPRDGNKSTHRRMHMACVEAVLSVQEVAA